VSDPERSDLRRETCRVLCIVALVLMAGSGHAASVADWRADIDEIVKDVRAIHPDPYARCGRLTFLRRAQALKAALPGLTEEQRMVGAMQLVALIGDTHTQLEPNRPDFALWYPIRIYEFSDGYFVTAAHASVTDLAGAQVLEVGGVPVERAVNDARGLMGADDAFAAKEGVFPFSNAALMKGLGYAQSDGSLRVKVRLKAGNLVERVLVAHRTDDPRFDKDDSTFEWHFQAEMGGPPFGGVEQWVSAYRGLPYAAFRATDLSRPLRLMNRRFFVARALPDQDAFYIQANFVGGDFASLFHDALLDVDKARPRRLIVDLRYNFGGDGSQVPAMAREFIARQGARPWKELYVITGRRTLSAGIMAAVAIMTNTERTVVGEPMAAPVNSFGDATSIRFPRSGLHLELSTVTHQLGDGNDTNEFAPVDVPTEMSFADYASGRDPAVDPILAGEEMRGLAVIALADGGAAARRAYEKRKAGLARFPWWSPPAEIELRTVTQELARQNRYDDAIEAASLNAEIHADIWNTWYNLGVAQRAAGRIRESLENWRKVLELDPENANADEIRKAFAGAGVAFQ
jgi:hypothetical protein